MSATVPFGQRWKALTAAIAVLQKSKIKVMSVSTGLGNSVIVVDGIPPLLGDPAAVICDKQGKLWRLFEHKMNGVHIRWQRPYWSYVPAKSRRVH